MKRLALLIPFLIMTACPPPNPATPQDPYRTARTAVTIMQTTLSTGKLAFDGVVALIKNECTVQTCSAQISDTTSAAYQACLVADHTAEAKFKSCFKIGDAVPWVEAGVKIGQEGCKTTLSAIQLAADLAQVRDDKKLRSACDGGDQAACTEYQKRVKAICLTVDPTQGEQYQLCVAGKPVAKADYTAMLKNTACLAYAAFKLVPADPRIDPYIKGVSAWLKGYGGCQ